MIDSSHDGTILYDPSLGNTVMRWLWGFPILSTLFRNIIQCRNYVYLYPYLWKQTFWRIHNWLNSPSFITMSLNSYYDLQKFVWYLEMSVNKLWHFLSLNSKKNFMVLLSVYNKRWLLNIYQKNLRELCENVLLGCKLILDTKLQDC